MLRSRAGALRKGEKLSRDFSRFLLTLPRPRLYCEQRQNIAAEPAGGSAARNLISPSRASCMKKFYLLVAIVALSVSGRASATLLLQDNFDGYANQAAFNASWQTVPGSVGTPPNQVFITSATLSTEQSVSSSNSIKFVAASGSPLAPIERNFKTFTESGNPNSTSNIVRFSFDFYDSDAAAAPYRQYGTLMDAAGTGNGQLISIGLNNNIASNKYMARIVGFSGGAFFQLNDAGSPNRSTGWHNLRVDITNTAFSFYVDGILSEVVLQSALPAGTPLRSYDQIRIGSGVSSTRAAFIDNVFVATVPEAGSFIAMGFVGMLSAGAVWIRKRRAGQPTA
jgi:hypothetical protein